MLSDEPAEWRKLIIRSQGEVCDRTLHSHIKYLNVSFSVFTNDVGVPTRMLMYDYTSEKLSSDEQSSYRFLHVNAK